MADAQDLKSCDPLGSCGFDSRLGYCISEVSQIMVRNVVASVTHFVTFAQRGESGERKSEIVFDVRWGRDKNSTGHSVIRSPFPWS